MTNLVIFGKCVQWSLVSNTTWELVQCYIQDILKIVLGCSRKVITNRVSTTILSAKMYLVVCKIDVRSYYACVCLVNVPLKNEQYRLDGRYYQIKSA